MCVGDAGELSAYQRQKMPFVRLLELGLLRPCDVKYAAAKDASTYKHRLHGEFKLSAHERALGRGSDDPLKSDLNPEKRPNEF